MGVTLLQFKLGKLISSAQSNALQELLFLGTEALVALSSLVFGVLAWRSSGIYKKSPCLISIETPHTLSLVFQGSACTHVMLLTPQLGPSSISPLCNTSRVTTESTLNPWTLLRLSVCGHGHESLLDVSQYVLDIHTNLSYNFF